MAGSRKDSFAKVYTENAFMQTDEQIQSQSLVYSLFAFVNTQMHRKPHYSQ